MPPNRKKAIADGAATVRQVTQAEAPRSKAAQAAAAFDLFDAPPTSAPSLEPVVVAAVNEQLPVAATPPAETKQRKERESLFNSRGNAKAGYKYGGVTVGSGRSFTAAEMQSATAIAEQVMQGTPLNEVIVAHDDYMPMDLMDDRAPDQRPPTSTVQVSSYLDPSTAQGQRAAEAAARSRGMGAAGAGMGSSGGGGNPPRPPATVADQPEDFSEPPAPPVTREQRENSQPPREPSVPPILREELEQRARIAGRGLLSSFKSGWKAQAGPGDRQNYSDSVIGDTFRGRQFPELEGAGPLEQAAFLAGRASGDVTGYGTRKLFWNLNPEDALGTATREAATWAGLNGRQAQLARYTGATALGLVSANYNPFNIGEGGRSVGFSAVNPNEDDPRKTDNPVGELLFDRMMLGRTGRLLPWEQFHEERPDVSYEKYAKYQDYIRGPSALGMFKATADGIDGPEARMMGYRVQPEAVAAALAAGAGVIAAFKYGGKGR